LLQRIHPPATRVKRLAEETPVLLIVFDLLADRYKPLTQLLLSECRPRLEVFASRYFNALPGFAGNSPTRRRKRSRTPR